MAAGAEHRSDITTLLSEGQVAAGKEWLHRSLPASAAAGTFGGQIEFSLVPAGILLRLEVADINTAGVFTLATDSI